MNEKEKGKLIQLTEECILLRRKKVSAYMNSITCECKKCEKCLEYDSAYDKFWEARKKLVDFLYEIECLEV